MAHFAELDDNNVVLRVIVVGNRDTSDADGVEDESIGVAYCRRIFGGRWVQTSYNNRIRKRYAYIGGSYNEELDAFVYPKPEQYPSWVLNKETADWEPPIPRPTDNVYMWDEATVSWVLEPKRFPSWIMHGNPPQWGAPIPQPSDGKFYKWDEPTLSWVEFTP